MGAMMKAAVLHGVNDVRVQEMPRPELVAPDYCVVKIDACGICGSDVHFFRHMKIGHFVVESPLILGHESAGTIVEVGAEVKSLKVGDRVAIEPGWTGDLVRHEDTAWGRITRVHPFPTDKRNIPARAAAFAGFTGLGGLAAVLSRSRPDAVLAMSPPLTLGLAGWLGVTFAAAAIGAVASADASTFYAQLVRPAWAPPASAFGPVWSALDLLMGVAAWLVWRERGAPRVGVALTLFVDQIDGNGQRQNRLALDALGAAGANVDPQITALQALQAEVANNGGEQLSALLAIDSALSSREASNQQAIDKQIDLATKQITEAKATNDIRKAQIAQMAAAVKALTDRLDRIVDNFQAIVDTSGDALLLGAGNG